MFRGLFRTRTLIFKNNPYTFRSPYHDFSQYFSRTRTRTSASKQLPYSVPFPHPKVIFYPYTLLLPFPYLATDYTVFRASWTGFFQANRVEHQKLNQTTPYCAVWLSFWCSTRPSADTVNKSVPTTSSLVKSGCAAIAKYITLYIII